VPGLAVAALVLALAVWLVYRPSLNRVFVMDQVWYFAELDGHTSLADGLRLYDYAATRRYWKDSDALFRPLLFTWLAAGNSLFSYHHVAWNTASLALHLLVAVCLFRLLVTIRPSPFALPIAVLFAVLKPPLELVVWNHLGGYLLACACLAIGLRAFVRLSRANDPRAASPALAAFAIAFTAAGFLHEAMAPIALVAAGLVLLGDRRLGRPLAIGRTLALCAPVLCFSAGYVFHMLRVARLTYVDRQDVHGLFEAANLLSLLPRSLDVLAHWTRELALPASLTFTPSVFGRLDKRLAFSWSSPLDLLNAGLCLAACLIALRAVSRADVRRMAPIATLVLFALCGYVGVVCLARPQHEALGIGYYLYPFSLLLVTLVYTLVEFDRMTTRAATLAGVVLAGFIALHGRQSHDTAGAIGRASQDASAYFTRVSRFVDAHRAEPDFTFRVETHPPVLDPEVELREGYPDDPRAVVRVTHVIDILFARYYREDNPKYVFRE
jgi:hypothetical protein